MKQQYVFLSKQICLVSTQPTMFPMIEPDVVPPGDGSGGGTGPLADLQGKRVAWSTDVLKLKSFPVGKSR
jgi:hypothetical protein